MRVQQRQAFRRVGIAHPLVELDPAGLPIGRNGLQQGIEVRGADNVDAASEFLGREGEAGKGGIAAV